MKYRKKIENIDLTNVWHENYTSKISATYPIELTHLPLVPHIWVSESDQHWFK